MSRLSFRPSVLPLAVAVGALALAACSDSPVSPTRSLASSSADFNVTGTNPLTITSGNATQLCTAQQVNGDYTIPAGPGYGPFAGCGVALDLTAAILLYNPGWSQPFAGSSWVGFAAKGGPSNEYRANPGRYVYQETFAIPASVTNPVLDIHVKADNVAAVYLNGKKLGSQTNTDCNPGVLVCNWNGDLHIVDNTAGDFVIGGNNTLTFLVIDLPTGAFELTSPTGGPAPQYGCTTRFPQPTGTLGYTATTVPTAPNHVVAGGGTGVGITNLGAANQAGCENPTGLDYAGTMGWTVASTTWCSPGYWKNHLDAWSVANQNKLYSSLVGAAPLGNKTPAGANPTLVQVISNPQIYGGPATNSVADYLSFIAFGTPIGSGIEGCPLN